jgi:acid phosphatase type 7
VRQLIVLVALLVLIVVLGVLSSGIIGQSGPGPSTSPTAEDLEGILVGAGDIATCPGNADEETAALIDQVVAEWPDAIVFTTGDNVYPGGSIEEYRECFEPSWGRHRSRTRPAVGNHDFGETKAAGYHEYWGERGGEFDRYYYSYDVGEWHVVVLSAECHRVGCDLDSEDGEQAEWLVADLEASDARCTIAIWHDPRWSSGRYGNNRDYATFWEILHDHGAEMVINGHEHLYERFEPMDPDGAVDRDRGIMQFTVGTGGGELRGFESIHPNSAARASEYGVLQLSLGQGRYEWAFLPVDEQGSRDSGSGACH